jgi:gamma-glutamylcysteine synthetase
MTPESSEGRERLSRLEERVESNRRHIERNELTFGPLPLSVALVQQAQDEFRQDLRDFRDSISARFREVDNQRKEDNADLKKRMADQNLALLDQVQACSRKIGDVAETVRKHHEAEAKRQEEEAKTVRVEKTQDVISRRTLYGVLGAAGLASIAALLTPIISALFG